MSAAGVANHARQVKAPRRTPRPPGSKHPTDVSLAKLQRDLERGVAYFWSRRGGSPFAGYRDFQYGRGQ